jgi:hypothetical protein
MVCGEGRNNRMMSEGGRVHESCTKQSAVIEVAKGGDHRPSTYSVTPTSSASFTSLTLGFSLLYQLTFTL